MSCVRKDLVINFEITKVHNKSEGNNENKIMKAKEKLCKHSDQTKPEKFKNRKWFSVFQNNVRGVKEEKIVVQKADFLPEDFIERCEIGPLTRINVFGTIMLVLYQLRKLNLRRTTKSWDA